VARPNNGRGRAPEPKNISKTRFWEMDKQVSPCGIISPSVLRPFNRLAHDALTYFETKI
jgi:hypothetical protein